MIHTRTLNSLEFGKITEYLAGLCCSAWAANAPWPLLPCRTPRL